MGEERGGIHIARRGLSRTAEQMTSVSGGHAQLIPPVTLRQLAAISRLACLFVEGVRE